MKLAARVKARKDAELKQPSSVPPTIKDLDRFLLEDDGKDLHDILLKERNVDDNSSESSGEKEECTPVQIDNQ